jgi:hypothetical protein
MKVDFCPHYYLFQARKPALAEIICGHVFIEADERAVVLNFGAARVASYDHAQESNVRQGEDT